MGHDGSDRLRDSPRPQEHQAGLVPEAQHGAVGVRADPRLRAVRGGVGLGAQGVHARGAERPAGLPDRVPATHAHRGCQLQARAGHRAGKCKKITVVLLFCLHVEGREVNQTGLIS